MSGSGRVRVCEHDSPTHDTRCRIHSSREARASRARRRRRARRFRLRRHRHFLHQLQLEQWQVLHWPCTLLGLHSLVHSLTVESPRTVELHGTPPKSPRSSNLQAVRRAMWAACRPQRRRVVQCCGAGACGVT